MVPHTQVFFRFVLHNTYTQNYKRPHKKPAQFGPLASSNSKKTPPKTHANKKYKLWAFCPKYKHTHTHTSPLGSQPQKTITHFPQHPNDTVSFIPHKSLSPQKSSPFSIPLKSFQWQHLHSLSVSTLNP